MRKEKRSRFNGGKCEKMKGLFLKDLKLMLQQKKTCLTVLAIGIGMAFLVNNLYFGIGYMVFCTTVQAINMINYSEQDNGMVFLMTLPITRKLFVQEKYCFAGMVSFAVAVIAVVLFGIIAPALELFTVPAAEVCANSMIILFLAWCMIAVNYPLLFYFGMERGRFIMSICWIVIMVLISVGVKMDDMTIYLEGITPQQLLLATLLISLIFLFLSYLCSICIIRRKEY